MTLLNNLDSFSVPRLIFPLFIHSFVRSFIRSFVSPCLGNFRWDLFTTSSKCSKIQWLHQLKFKTWKMCPFQSMRCAHTHTRKNRQIYGFILIKLKSNFFSLILLLFLRRISRSVFLLFADLQLQRNWIVMHVIGSFYAISARALIIKALKWMQRFSALNVKKERKKNIFISNWISFFFCRINLNLYIQFSIYFVSQTWNRIDWIAFVR